MKKQQFSQEEQKLQLENQRLERKLGEVRAKLRNAEWEECTIEKQANVCIHIYICMYIFIYLYTSLFMIVTIIIKSFQLRLSFKSTTTHW